MDTTPRHLSIVTGASRGMGLGIARQLLQDGHELICISRHVNAELARHAQMLGLPLQQWQFDLADAAPACAQLANWLAGQSAQAFTSVTLINNAAVIPPIGPLSEAKGADLALTLRVGLEAPMQLCAAFLHASAHWRALRRVLNISSGLGRRPLGAQAPYCAVKAGMDHFTRCLALEEAIKPNGAKVCSLAPGVIDTDMQTQLRSAPEAGFPDVGYFKALKSEGKLPTPAEAARSVLAYLQRADFGHNPVGDIRDPV